MRERIDFINYPSVVVIPSNPQCDEWRKRIESATDQFLANGGKIEKLEIVANVPVKNDPISHTHLAKALGLTVTKLFYAVRMGLIPIPDAKNGRRSGTWYAAAKVVREARSKLKKVKDAAEK